MNESKYGKHGWKVLAVKLAGYAVVIVAIGLVAIMGIEKIIPMIKEWREAAANDDYTQEEYAFLEENSEFDDSYGTGTVVSEPITMTLLEGTPDAPMVTYTNLPVAAASATSTISQNGVDNTPGVLFDGQDGTTWQEGVDGYGIGESVSFSFDKTYQVKYVAFKLGHWGDDRHFRGNATPKTLNIVIGPISQEITFTGEQKVEWVELSEKVTTDSMRVEIVEVYPGESWEDTCISEIAVYGD